MKITFDLDDRLVESIEEHLNTQVRQTADPVTGANRLKRVFKDVPDFLTDVLHQVVNQLAMQYPPAHLQEQIAAKAKLEADIKASLRPVATVG